MFLIDTDLISSTFPASTRVAEVQSFLDRHWLESFLSVLSLGELWFGVMRLRLQGASRRATSLGAWVEDVENTYAERLLAADLAIGRRTGDMLARAEKAGHRPGFVDACLAATAAERALTVLTFNARHFQAFGVSYRKPVLERREP